VTSFLALPIRHATAILISSSVQQASPFVLQRSLKQLVAATALLWLTESITPQHTPECTGKGLTRQEFGYNFFNTPLRPCLLFLL